MLSKLYLDKKLYEGYNLLNDEYCLSGLGRVNVFIGQNNSGKSRFLRKLFVDNHFEFDLKKHAFEKLVNLIREKKVEIRGMLDSVHINEAGETFKRIDLLSSQVKRFKIGEVKKDIDKVKEVASYYLSLTKYGGWSNQTGYHSTSSPDRLIPNVKKIGRELMDMVDELFPTDFDYKIDRIYIPMLKGLRPIQIGPGDKFEDHNDNYKLRTIRDYFQEEKLVGNGEEIFTGLKLYEDTKKLLLGDKLGRERIKKFEEFLSQNFFDNQEITLIPDINNDVLLIGIGEEERPVYQLGDGIQSVIILLYPLFFSQDKNLMVFIEEPENSLHPGMQRIFLETLMKEEFKSFQFFITTHSNHFLDITLDLENISIYTFKKNKVKNSNEFSYLIENTSNDDIKVLDLIGARNASVFLSNCTIWVEGITDRLYLKTYLDVYQKHLCDTGKLKSAYKEDFNYSFIEYGGGNLVHWSFTNELGWEKIQAARISSKIFVIADRDSSDEKPNSAKGLRLAQLKEKLGERFEIVGGREIENILSEQVLIKSICILEGKNSPKLEYDLKKIKFKKYQNQKLGKYIQTNFTHLNRNYEAKSGTIYCKMEFCKASISIIKSIEDFSEEAMRVTEKMFHFIKSSNE